MIFIKISTKALPPPIDTIHTVFFFFKAQCVHKIFFVHLESFHNFFIPYAVAAYYLTKAALFMLIEEPKRI